MRAGVVFTNADLLSVIREFSRKNEYLFIGTVNKSLYRLCVTKQTNMASCLETVSRLQELQHSGIQFSNHGSLYKHVMKCGSIDVMRHALHTGLVNNLNGALEHAIRSNDTQLITALDREFDEMKIGPSCLVAAVESGSLAMVEAYCADGVLDHRAPNFGLKDNYFHPFDMTAKRMICRQWKIYVGDYLIGAAKRYGHFEILKWLHAEKIPTVNELSETYDIIGEAAAHGNREMVEWMLVAGYHPSACEIPYASHSNDVSYLEWLLTKGCLIDPEALTSCTNSNSTVITWLQSKGYYFDLVA